MAQGKIYALDFPKRYFLKIDRQSQIGKRRNARRPGKGIRMVLNMMAIAWRLVSCRPPCAYSVLIFSYRFMA
jgi:hypothetical protein